MSDARSAIEVLLVEDNPVDARLTQEVLKDASIPSRFTVVSDGAEALSYLRREGPYSEAPRPDLILLDLNLPRMDGREVLAGIRGDRELAALPVVILSATSAEAEIAAALAAQASSCLRKPIDPVAYAELVAVLVL
jgi:two-component system, chemotaxis family, response regulator Rcp1